MYTAGQVDWACSRGGLHSPRILFVIYQQQFFLYGQQKQFSWDPKGKSVAFTTNKRHRYYLLMPNNSTGWLQGAKKMLIPACPQVSLMIKYCLRWASLTFAL